MTKHTAVLILYIGVVIAATMVHQPWILGAGLIVALAIAGRNAPRLARRALFAILFFNLIVTISYIAIAIYRNDISWTFVLLINLRVFLLTFITFLVVDRVNLYKGLSFSKTLSYLLTLAASQIIAFRRLFEDFRLAFRSRTPRRGTSKDLYRHGATVASFFLQKSFQESAEITDAMTSRGFFND